MSELVKRGQIWWVSLNRDIVGSEQMGDRLALIVQNNIGNKYSPTTLIAPITSKPKNNMPTHVKINLDKDSVILCEHILAIDKARLQELYGNADEQVMSKVDDALLVSLGLLPTLY